MKELWSTHLYNVASFQSGSGVSFLHSSPLVPPQYFSILILFFFLVIVLQIHWCASHRHPTVSYNFIWALAADRWAHLWLQRSLWSAPCPNHPSCITGLESWSEVFVLICSFWQTRIALWSNRALIYPREHVLFFLFFFLTISWPSNLKILRSFNFFLFYMTAFVTMLRFWNKLSTQCVQQRHQNVPTDVVHCQLMIYFLYMNPEMDQGANKAFGFLFSVQSFIADREAGIMTAPCWWSRVTMGTEERVSGYRGSPSRFMVSWLFLTGWNGNEPAFVLMHCPCKQLKNEDCLHITYSQRLPWKLHQLVEFTHLLWSFFICAIRLDCFHQLFK